MSNTYELAFHLDPTLDEGNIAQIREGIEKSVTSGGGAISFSKEPEKTRLSYPVKDHNVSYFGYIQFNMVDSSGLKQIQDQIIPNPSVLRSLVLKLEPDSQKQKDVMRKMAMAEKGRKSRAASQKAESDKAAEPPVQEEELEKKLEEIIDKL